MTSAVLAQVMKAKGDLDGALAYQHKALAIKRKVRGNDHLEVAITLGNIGRVGVVCRSVCRSVRCSRIPGLASTIAGVLMFMVEQAMKAKGDLNGALTYQQQALAIKRKALGDHHPSVAATLNNIGLVGVDCWCTCIARGYVW